jgi:hypothetical protein
LFQADGLARLKGEIMTTNSAKMRQILAEHDKVIYEASIGGNTPIAA